MSARALPGAAASRREPRRLLAELVARDRALALAGLAFLAALPVALALQAIDPRALAGVNVWVKPAKFLAALGLFLLTLAWFQGHLDASWRRSAAGRYVAWVAIAGATLEIAWIGFQAARGEPSHFNETTPLSAWLYRIMGVVALLMTTAPLVQGVAILRRGDPALDPAYRLALGLGLILTCALAATQGFHLATSGGHAVGGVAGAPALPLTGWSRSGGDLRVAHFLAVHAQQLLPLAGAAVAWMTPGRGRPLVVLLALGYVAATILLVLQALAGRPLIAA
jgi:hypothetical protein